MAKGSYFAKHKAQIGAEQTDEKIRLVQPSITVEKRESFEAGKVLLIDKDLHWTSFDAVRKIRNALRIKKVGHAGTLDPLATGLLIICTGKFTKRINEFMAQPKEYEAEITLGATTATYDLESMPENFKTTDTLTEEMIREKSNLFLGEIMQMPPIYSAIKKEGVAAYELARRGEKVALEPRPITIYNFEITAIDLPIVRCIIRCSTGTYIRSLAHDFGEALQCGGHLSALRRTKIGEASVEDAQTISAFIESLH